MSRALELLSLALVLPAIALYVRGKRDLRRENAVPGSTPSRTNDSLTLSLWLMRGVLVLTAIRALLLMRSQ